MADNITVTPGVGATVAAELVGGALIQRVKVALGALDSDAGDIATANPMPITIVGGTAPSTPVTGTFWQATQPVSVSGGNVVLAGGTSAIGTVIITSGTVGVSFPASIGVNGTVTAILAAGTSNAGTVNIGTIPTVTSILAAGTSAIGTVNVGTMPAITAILATGTSNIGSVLLAGGTTTTNLAQIAGNSVSTSVGATGSGVQRVVLADNMGRTLLVVSGSTQDPSKAIIAASGSLKNKVYAFSLTTLQNASAVNCSFTDGTSGSSIWQVVLQAISGASTGANLAVTPPAFLFSNSSINTPIGLNLVGGTTNAVNYSLSYFQDAT